MIDEQLFERDINILEKRYLDKYENPVVFYGSSSIRLWTGLQKDFPDLEILNLAFGGATIKYCIHYFDRLVVPVNMRSFVFYAGDNDIGFGRLPEEIFTLFGEFYYKFRRYFPDTKFTFVSIKPSPDRFPAIDRIQITNRMIKNFLAKESNTFFLNIFDYMMNGNGYVREDLFVLDGLHMNSKGYDVWKEQFEKNRDEIFN